LLWTLMQDDLLASSCKQVQMINNLWKPTHEEALIDMYYD